MNISLQKSWRRSCAILSWVKESTVKAIHSSGAHGQVFALAKEMVDMPLSIEKVLESPIHEARAAQ